MRWPFAARTAPAPDVAERSLSPTTRFAFKLFRHLESESESGNLFYSPASVMLCLWMLLEGATGETREAMAQALELVEPGSGGWGLVAADLKSGLQLAAPGILLACANSVWCNAQLRPRSEYVSKVRQDFDAEAITLNFVAPDAVMKINGWVAEKTHHKITGILSQLNPLDMLVAINAIYFKGLWSAPFEESRTEEDLFHKGNGRTARIPFMDKNGSFHYCETSKFQAIKLPYENSRLAMYVFLPRQSSSLEAFLENLTSAAWDEWMKKFESLPGHLRLPRFQLTYGANLRAALGKLGMGIAFEPARARFDDISLPPPSIWIGQVLHRAFVEVNEKGTEAAAVTVATITAMGRWQPPTRTFEMIVNRPFFFAIRDDVTGTVLFLGAVKDPGIT